MATTYAPQVLGARAQPRSHALEARLAVAGVLVCVGAVAMAAASAQSDAAFGRGLLQLLIVGVPIAVGLYALRSPVNKSFGIALLGIGFAWSLTALAESPDSVPHTIGRLSTWLTFPCVVYLLLAFPHGRIERGFDRAVFLGILGVMVFLFYGTAPFLAAFPPKTLWSTCITDCPANALFILDEEPAFMTQVVLAREWLVELLWVGIFYSMYRRWRAASPLQRQAVGPAFVAGALLGVSHYVHITTRQLGAPADTVIALSSIWTFCIVAVCAAFLFGLVRKRMLLAGALARLGAALRASDDRAQIRDELATALGDSTTELLFHDPGSGAWHDARGRSVRGPQEPAGDRAVTAIYTDDGRHHAAMVHDVALLDDRELLDGVSGMVLAGWRHEQLAADLGRAMSDLDDSRRRIAEAADVERARIERDLHDGAQQRLVALRIRLGITEDLLKTDPRAGAMEIHELGFEAERALEELRSLAHGVYPPLLTDRGLADALRVVAAQAPIPVHLSAAAVRRYPIEIESAVYFTCAEALQNALKHAGGVTGVWVELRETPGTLHFEVRDDGRGFSPSDHDGRGLRNMHDRIEAIGGNLTVDSTRGYGTRVSGSVSEPGP
ncbi:MAG TPA: histidine kinase [Thermoleophilaceae bacterium]|nr:histidine kinase [Thermoleophilaceae bacterium]